MNNNYTNRLSRRSLLSYEEGLDAWKMEGIDKKYGNLACHHFYDSLELALYYILLYNDVIVNAGDSNICELLSKVPSKYHNKSWYKSILPIQNEVCKWKTDTIVKGFTFSVSTVEKIIIVLSDLLNDISNRDI